MILKHKAELAGRVKLQISGGARGTIDYPWFDNMILDQGLVGVLTRPVNQANMANRFGWGSSSQPVAATDTDLVQPLGKSTAIPTITRGYNESGGYGFTRSTLELLRGEAAGNLSELVACFSVDAGNAACRTLIKDSNGNPTTITVLADEILRITWEIRKYWEIQAAHSVTYERDLIDITTNVSYVPRAELPTVANALGNGADVGFGGDLVSGFTAQRLFSFSESQGNPSIATCPSSLAQNAGAVFPYHATYARFNPPIPKTNEFKCDIIWELTLSRRGE